ncbi:MAG TPA: PIN domain-containing protein [Puia sp.]|nr:PIN domain-containing protein [Puia sp.]
MVHLDTNFLIEGLRPGSPEQAQVLAWWSARNDDVNVSSVVWAEFFCGPLSQVHEQKARHFFPTPEPLLPADAEMAALLFNKTGRRSRSLADCMIAAVALRSHARLATINTADFQPFVQHGLTLV